MCIWHLCITFCNISNFEGLNFPSSASAVLLLEKQLEKGAFVNYQKCAFMCQNTWNKVWYISCGGKGKVFYRVLHTEHSHRLNTAKEIIHLPSTWNCKKNCSLWMSPIERPWTQPAICFALHSGQYSATVFWIKRGVHIKDFFFSNHW